MMTSKWWNDEGETQWLNYLYWNMAQRDEYAAALPGQRHWTINRAFLPGIQQARQNQNTKKTRVAANDMYMYMTCT